MGTAFEPTDWQPGVTPYSTSEMNRIEQGIVGAAPVGHIIMSPGPQTGYVELDGSVLSRSTYDALFDYADANDLVGPGKFFGDGDGATTFQLPDWHDRMPIGASAARPVGSQGGSEDHAHTNPSTSAAGGHSHSQSGTGSAGSHAHSNPSTSSTGSHAHTNGRTGTGGGHSHSNPSTGGPSSTKGASTASGPFTSVASDTHTHSVGSTGSVSSHDHNVPTSNSNGDHSHSQGNTGSGGSHSHSNPNTDSAPNHSHSQGATGTADHLPPWAAVIWLIRY